MSDGNKQTVYGKIGYGVLELDARDPNRVFRANHFIDRGVPHNFDLLMRKQAVLQNLF